jgi:Mrp family chromosome partitioning ATPase
VRCYPETEAFVQADESANGAPPNLPMSARDRNSLRNAFANGPTTMADYLAILRRRAWLIVLLPVVAASVAFELSKGEPPLYQAQARVLVNRAGGVVAAIANVQAPDTFDSIRFLATQAEIARSPELAARAVAAAGVPGMTAGSLLAASTVTPEQDADLLDISVKSPNASDAVLLTNAYAREFTRYKTGIDTARINAALSSLRKRIKSLRAGSLPYETLTQYEGQLETIGRLLANNTSLLDPAEGAANVSRSPRRSLVLGGVLGAALALGLVFLVEALDRRARTEQEFEALLELPLLGRVSPPLRRLRKKNHLVMLAAPLSAQAEAFRKLRATIEYANSERGAKTIMFTSAVAREGKSTTVANLAVAFARAGRRVALIDLDVRRPFLHSFFHVGPDHGIADVVVNGEPLLQAMHQVALPLNTFETNGRPATTSSSSNGHPDAERILHLLPCGVIPHADPDFLNSARVSAVVEELGQVFDIVLVDAPPLLAVGEAMTLSTKVDAIVAVTRLGTERPVLRELARQLQNCHATTLGFILTGVPQRINFRYGYVYDAYGYGAAPNAERRRQRI